jgi:hypothetical protein
MAAVTTTGRGRVRPTGASDRRLGRPRRGDGGGGGGGGIADAADDGDESGGHRKAEPGDDSDERALADQLLSQ